MAQGPPLLSVECTTAVAPNGVPSCPSPPTCRSTNRYHLPPAASSTNITAHQSRHYDVVREPTVFLHSVCHGAVTLAEKVVGSVHCAALSAAEAFELLKSGGDACRTQAAESEAPAACQSSVSEGPESDTEAGRKQGASARLAEPAAHEPTDQRMARRRSRCETTDPGDNSKVTIERPLQWESQPVVKAGTLSVYASATTAEATVSASKVSSASRTGSSLSPPQENIVHSRQCTTLPTKSSTVLDGAKSVAVAATLGSTANPDAPVPVLKAACADEPTRAKSVLGDSVTVPFSTARVTPFDAAGSPAAVKHKLPQVSAPVGVANVASASAVPCVTPAAALKTSSTAAASNAAAATRLTGGAPVAPAPYRGEEEICQPLPPCIHLWKDNVHNSSNGSEGSGSPGFSRSYGIAQHTEACTERNTHGRAVRCSCSTGNLNKTVEKGDTADPSMWHANAQLVRVDPGPKDAQVLSGCGTSPDLLSRIATLELCEGEEFHCAKRRRPAKSASDTERNDCSDSGRSSDSRSSLGSSHIHDDGSVNGGLRRNVNASSDTSIRCSCNNNADCSSRCSSRGGGQNCSTCPFPSRVGSCRSTTVSTPSPVASSTSRSVRSSCYERKDACCLIGGCITCDPRSGHSSCESGKACKGTRAFEHQNSLMVWCEISPAALLECSCSCSPSPALSCSGSTLPAASAAATYSCLVCTPKGEHKSSRAPHVPNATDAGSISRSKQQLTAAYCPTEAHHGFCALHKNSQMQPRPPPLEELRLPAAVVLPGDPLIRAQHQRQLPQSPTLPLASHPLENALVQAAASATPAPSANGNGSGARFCSNSLTWSSISSSVCSPSVFSQVPIVPLSAWPVPATYVYEDGVARLETPVHRDSPDSVVECSPCSRQRDDLISYHSWTEDCKFEETVLQHIHLEDRRDDFLNCRKYMKENHHQRLQRQLLHSQPLASFLSGTADQYRVEPFSSDMVKRTATPYTKNHTQVFCATSAAEEESVAIFPDEEEGKANGSSPVETAVMSPFENLQLPLRSAAENWLLLHIAWAPKASMSSEQARDPTTRGVAGFCSSTLRTATLLLGDHDPESTSASDFNVCHPTSLDEPEHREELYLHSMYGNGEEKLGGADSPFRNGCGVKVSEEESSNSRSGSGNAFALKTTTKRRDNLQRQQAVPKIMSALDPGSVAPSETASCSEDTSCPAPVTPQVLSAAAHNGRAAGTAVGCPVASTVDSPESSALGLAADVASSFVRSEASHADDIAGCPAARAAAQSAGAAFFHQPGVACSVGGQECASDRVPASKEKEWIQGQRRPHLHQEENQLLRRREDDHQYTQQERESKPNTDGVYTVIAKGNTRSAAAAAHGVQAYVAAALNEGAQKTNGLATRTGRSGAAIEMKEVSATTAQATSTDFPKPGRQRQSSPAAPSWFSELTVSQANILDIPKMQQTLHIHSPCPKVPMKGTHEAGQGHPDPSDSIQETKTACTTAEAPDSTTAAKVLAATTASSEFRFEESLVLHAAPASCHPSDDRSIGHARSNGLILAGHVSGEALGEGATMGRNHGKPIGSIVCEEERPQLLQGDCAIATAGIFPQGTPSLPRHRRADKGGTICESSETRHRRTPTPSSDSRRCSRSSSRGSVSSTSTQSGLPSYLTSRSSSTRCSPLTRRRREPLAVPAVAADAVVQTSTAADICVSAANLLSSIAACKPTVTSSQHTEVVSHVSSSTSDPHDLQQCSRELSSLATASGDAGPRLSTVALPHWGASALTEGPAGTMVDAAATSHSLQEPVRPAMFSTLCHTWPSPPLSVEAAVAAGAGAAASQSSATSAGVASVAPAPGKTATATSLAVESADVAAAAAALKNKNQLQSARRLEWRPHISCERDGVLGKISPIGESTTASSSSPHPQAGGAPVELIAPTASANEVGHCSRKLREAETSTCIIPAVTSRLESCASESAASAAPESVNMVSCKKATCQQQFVAPHFSLAAKNIATDEESIITAAAGGGTTATSHKSSLCRSEASSTNIRTERAQEAERAGVSLLKPAFTDPREQQKGVHQTLWSRNHNFENAQQGGTQNALSVAREPAVINGVTSNSSNSGLKHHEPLRFTMQHFQKTMQHVQLPHLRSHETQEDSSQSVPSVQHYFLHQQSQEQRKQKPTQSHGHYHYLGQKPCQEELVAPVDEGLFHGRSLNARFNPPDYLTPRGIADSRCSKQNSPDNGSGLTNSVRQKDNSSNHPECNSIREAPTETEMPGTLFAAQTAFISCSMSDRADSFSRSSARISATSDCAAAAAAQSSPLSSQRRRGGKTRVVNGNSRKQFDVQPVKDSNSTVSSSYQPCNTLAANSTQAAFTVKVAPVPTYYSDRTALASSTVHCASQEGSSSWKHSEEPVSSSECPQPTNVCVTSATAPSNDFELLPDPVLKAAESRQVLHQLREVDLQTNLSPLHFKPSRRRVSSSQDATSKHMLEGLIQEQAAAPGTSDKWLSTITRTQTKMGAQELPEATAGVRDGVNEVLRDAMQNSQQHGPPYTRQDVLPAERGTNFSSARALDDGGNEKESTPSAVMSAAIDGDAVLLLGATQGTTSEKAALLYGRPDGHSDATDAPAAYGDAFATQRLPAAAHCRTDDMYCAAPVVSAAADEKTQANADTSPTANDKADVVKEPKRESLITMSDGRWIALRRSGLFRLGDKGRASIKSRIAKQLRLCPELRRAAAAIGGGGVRCATTKQLYQLADLCGFDDVLPPEFRRPRSGTEQQHQGMTSASAATAAVVEVEGRTATQFSTADITTCYSRPEHGDSRYCSSSSALHFSTSSSSSSTRKIAPDAAAARESSSSRSASAVLDNTTSCGLSSDADNVIGNRVASNHDDISCSSSRLFNSLPCPHYSEKHTAESNLDSFPKPQQASVLEEWQQQQQPQQHQQPHPAANDLPENKTRRSKQQTKRRSSAAAMQHDTSTWPLLVMDRWQGQQPTSYQQHHRMQQLQLHHEPPLQRQYQLYAPHPSQQHEDHSNTQPHFHYTQASKQQLRYQQEQLHPLLQQQQQQPQQQHGLTQHDDTRLLTLPRDSAGHFTPCGNSTTVQQHVQLQAFSLQTQQEEQQLQDSKEELYLLQQKQQQQWFQLGQHLLQRESPPPDHREKMLHNMYFHEPLERPQKAAQVQSAQNQSCSGDPHTCGGTVAPPHAAEPLNEFAKSTTSAVSGDQASVGITFVGSSYISSAADVAASANPHASAFRLPPAAGSSIAANKCTTTSSKDHIGSSSSIGCDSDRSSKWICMSRTGHSGGWSRETDAPSVISDFGSVYHIEQDCQLQRLSGRVADQQLQHDQQQHMRQRFSRLEAPAVNGWTPHKVDSLAASDSTATASSDKVSATTPHSATSAMTVSGRETGVLFKATSDRAVTGSATGEAVINGIHRHDQLLQQAYPETGITAADTAPPPPTTTAASSPTLFTRKVCALQQIPCLSVLSQSAQSTSPPSASPQSWGGNGTSTTLTCGSCSTKSSRSCLAEDPRTVAAAPQAETSRIPFAKVVVGTAAVQSISAGKSGLLSVDTPSCNTTAGAASGCSSLLPTSEPLENRRTDVVEARSRHEHGFPQAGPSRKRCRVAEITGNNAAGQQCFPAKAYLGNTEEQHPSAERCFLDRCDIAQQQQGYQPRKKSGSAYPQDSCQLPIGLLPQVCQREQLHNKKDIPTTTADTQELGIITQTQQQQALLPQQHAQSPQVSQQLPRKVGSPRSPCFVSKLSDQVGASRYDSTVNEGRLQLPPDWQKAPSRPPDTEQLPQYTSKVHARNFSPVKKTPRQQKACSRKPPPSACQEVSRSSAESLSRRTSDHVYSGSNGGISTWVSAVDTRVVDDFFDVQSTLEIGSPSGSIRVDHDDGALMMQECNGTSL